MKKITFIVAGLLLFVPSMASADFAVSLSYGSSGTAVLQLQQFLASQHCLSATPTGYFGSLTLAAVKCFQVKYGIPGTGFFGAMSRTEANSLLGASFVGSTGMTAQGGSTTVACPSGWTCLPGPVQGLMSPANLSQGALAPASVTPLSGSGTTTIIAPTVTNYIFSPLVGAGTTTVIPSSQTVSPTANLSPLVGTGSTTFIQ